MISKYDEWRYLKRVSQTTSGGVKSIPKRRLSRLVRDRDENCSTNYVSSGKITMVSVLFFHSWRKK
jgi:hypothetical protein